MLATTPLTTPPTVLRSEKKNPILLEDSEMKDKQDPYVVNVSLSFHAADGTQAMFDSEGCRGMPKNTSGAKSSSKLIQHKCILRGFLSDLVTLDITNSIRIKIMNTPFYHFLRSSKLVVYAYLLDDIYGCHIVNDTFQLGTKQLLCTDKDFVCIMGLLYCSTTIDPWEFTP